MDGSPQITIADAPFDSEERADIILRSADKVDFYAMKAFLAFSSPVLRYTFTRRQPAQDAGTRTSSEPKYPIVNIAAESAPLRNVLLFCYPGMQPTLEDGGDIIAAYTLAEDFKMEVIMKQLEDRLLVSEAIKKEPLRIFAIAVRRGWERVGGVAARNTLAIPFIGGEFPLSEELTAITGADVLHLLEYRQKCANAIRTWFVKHAVKGEELWRPKNSTSPECRWSLQPSSSCVRTEECQIYLPTPTLLPTSSQAKSSTGPYMYRAPGWWTEYLGQLLTELYLCPSSSIVLDNRLSDAAILAATDTSLACPICCHDVHRQIGGFKVDFARAIEQEISKIPLNIDFIRSKATPDIGNTSRRARSTI